MNLKKSHFFSLLGGVVLGGLIMFLSTNNLKIRTDIHAADFSLKDDSSQMDQSSQKRVDPFSQFDQMRLEMRRQMDQMMARAFDDSDDDFFKSSLFSDSGIGAGFEKSALRPGIQVTHGEDDEYKFIKISGEGVDKETLDIKVKEGMVSISGQVKKISGDGKGSQSTYISRFSQSFNIPSGVSEQDLEVENEDDSLILKFKKKMI
ncbi:MAG: hypothetical protein CME63_15985 [Halobacteriovoraceae bacterium]|nr:hypothetical protein [Halobacteriovoraceae bacterium]|tara:strand:+ start:32044 stop:32658 length:615 start_codon:yes stop_codon:yes gene_type:complete